jgi:branched-chain amino acid transport system substrate-binding protein
MGWDVPVVGQTTLGSGQTKALLEKPENWAKVYSNNFKNCCYGADGKLPPIDADFRERIAKAKVDMNDTLLWWIACGYDAPKLIAETVKAAGDSPKDITAYLNKLSNWKGVNATLTFTPEQHNGVPDAEVVMAQANSLKDGAFNLAPGYGA